ncbi:hypothetical protein LIA77_05054 [Sarocladium implicatum]|jgi:hypothetical protein|nr:hypothetical protein LIA77_05054 [Sarocladium implicatum]
MNAATERSATRSWWMQALWPTAGSKRLSQPGGPDCGLKHSMAAPRSMKHRPPRLSRKAVCSECLPIGRFVAMLGHVIFRLLLYITDQWVVPLRNSFGESGTRIDSCTTFSDSNALASSASWVVYHLQAPYAVASQRRVGAQDN